jgi:hypothetical protein
MFYYNFTYKFTSNLILSQKGHAERYILHTKTKGDAGSVQKLQKKTRVQALTNNHPNRREAAIQADKATKSTHLLLTQPPIPLTL